jgi:hypothetical protein
VDVPDLTPADRDSMIIDLMLRIKSGMPDRRRTKDMTMVQESLRHDQLFLEGLGDRLIHDIHRAIIIDEKPYSHELFALLSFRRTPVEIHEYLAFRPLLPNVMRVEHFQSLIAPLHKYASLPAMGNYGEAPDVMLKSIAALLTVTHRLHLITNDLPIEQVERLPVKYDYVLREVMLTDDALVRLVLDHPGDAERIADIIIDRQATDPELISTLLTTESPALGDGII